MNQAEALDLIDNFFVDIEKLEKQQELIVDDAMRSLLNDLLRLAIDLYFFSGNENKSKIKTKISWLRLQLTKTFDKTIDNLSQKIEKKLIKAEALTINWKKPNEIKKTTYSYKNQIGILRQQNINMIENVVNDSKNEILNLFTQNSLVPLNDSLLTNQITKIILEKDNKISLINVLWRTVGDILMQQSAFSSYLDTVDTGDDRYLYYGNLIRDSRSFCKLRAGKVYTRRQINSWQALSWPGKAPGSIWIQRGGYNCRHFFLPLGRNDIPENEIVIQKL